MTDIEQKEKEIQFLHLKPLTEFEQKIFDKISIAIDYVMSLPKTDEERKSTAKITRRIKNDVAELGKEKEFETFSTEHNAEWMYDLIWFNQNNIGLTNIELVLESELSDRNWNSLKRDFEKLLLANAKTRVMFCFNKGNYDFPKNLNNLVSSFTASFNNFGNLQNKDRLLLIIWDDYYTGKVYPFVLEKQNPIL